MKIVLFNKEIKIKRNKIQIMQFMYAKMKNVGILFMSDIVGYYIIIILEKPNALDVNNLMVLNIKNINIYILK